MEATLFIQELEKIDRYNDPDRFYGSFWKGKINLFGPEENQKILGLSEEIKDRSPLNTAHHAFALGMISIYNSDFQKVVENLNYAADIFDSLGKYGGVMASRTMLCSSYRSLGQLDKAHDSMQQALQYAPGIKPDDPYQFFKGVTYYQAAEINVELKNYDSAFEYYNTGIEFTKEHPELRGRFLNGLGVFFMNQEKYDEAKSYLEQSLLVMPEGTNPLLESKIRADLGVFYFKKKDYQNSFLHQEKSLKMRLERGLMSPATTNYIKLAELCFASGKTEDALKYAETAAEHAEKLKLNIKLYEAHHILAEIYDHLGDPAKALFHYKKYNQCKDEVHSQEVMRKVEQLKNQHKVESAEHEKEIFRLRNVELKAAMEEITESFRYAKRIQKAILPPDSLIRELLPESFVLFKPKDIVSGDFYWLEKIGNKILIAAVDCTGHGVPGAMVSVVGYNCLNRTVREFGLSQPAEILNKLTELVEGTFQHKDFQSENAADEIKDGMDISICSIDLSAKKMEWAGANNPLWIHRRGELMEIAADKQPVGKFDYRQPFTNHAIDLQADDSIYLFTDGYADQFGGPNGKKFKYRQLKDLLIESCKLDMMQQKAILDETFESWKNDLEQIDDVCIVGIRI
jgi:serine phosphatase RsbU (regulator of sigma subunit)/Tfp pilus assembly protein PilF